MLIFLPKFLNFTHHIFNYIFNFFYITTLFFLVVVVFAGDLIINLLILNIFSLAWCYLLIDLRVSVHGTAYLRIFTYLLSTVLCVVYPQSTAALDTLFRTYFLENMATYQLILCNLVLSNLIFASFYPCFYPCISSHVHFIQTLFCQYFLIFF